MTSLWQSHDRPHEAKALPTPANSRHLRRAGILSKVLEFLCKHPHDSFVSTTVYECYIIVFEYLCKFECILPVGFPAAVGRACEDADSVDFSHAKQYSIEVEL